MNIEVEMKPEVGPWIPTPIRSEKELNEVIVPDAEVALSYVIEAVKMTNQALNDQVPLIGFAGSPGPYCAMPFKGKALKTLTRQKPFALVNPNQLIAYFQMITDTTIDYLKAKVAAGVDAVQLFDSWGGLLSPEDYNIFSWPYIQQIVTALKTIFL